MWADASPRGAARRPDPAAVLRERIERLEEENRQLHQLLAPNYPLPASWRFSRLQTVLIRALRAAAPGLLTPERLEVALYSFRDPPETNSARVLVGITESYWPLVSLSRSGRCGARAT